MKYTHALLLATTAMLLAACGDNTPPEEIVKQRALERWAIREQGKVAGLYDFISPAKRQTVDRDAYEKRFYNPDFKYYDVVFKNISCQAEQNTCRIKLHVDYEVSGQYGNNRAGTELTETWAKQDNQWWFVK